MLVACCKSIVLGEALGTMWLDVNTACRWGHNTADIAFGQIRGTAYTVRQDYFFCPVPRPDR